jgi:diguanylate cyclase (GGDEF)-like protein
MSAPTRNRHHLRLLAAAILLAGLALAAVGASAWRSSVRASQKRAFQTTATEVSDTAQTLLRRDTDFVGMLTTVLTMQPDLSPDRFNEWYTELEGWQRQVGGLGTTVVRSVPAARLASFLHRRNSDPRFRVLVGKIVPVAREGRSRYCLISTSESITGFLSAQLGREVQGDSCQASSAVGRTLAPLQSLAADSGGLLALPVLYEGVHTLLFEKAFYRHEATVSTLADRRLAVNGWLTSSFDIATLLSTALAGHDGLEVSLYHANSGHSTELVGHEGTGARGGYSHSSTANVEGPWTVTVRGTVATGGLSASAQGLIALAIGILVTLLVTALMLVLTRSRARALDMVEEKTGELRHRALHDALTGLPNRTLALDRAEQMLARARRQNIPVAALYVDVDGFKHVNDTFGHAAGDELLQIVANRLTGVIRDGDTAARLGGDEFLVLIDDSTLDAAPELVAERLLEVLRQPCELSAASGRQLSLTASVGIAVGVRASADELLRDADLALYEAKADGRNRHALFRSDMQTASQDRLMLQMDLAEALDADQLFLLYQPTFDLQTEATTGVEALLRWEHPTRGTIPPDGFIPIAEASGLIIPIGRWVLHEACRQAAVWHGEGHQLGIAVNVSARQLDSDELIDDVRDALEASGLEAGSLTLEVTETTIMRDAVASAARLHTLKRLGVRIAIDDFGTGYSSLAYLRQFPADALKIDRSFISGIASSKQSAALIHTLVQLGRTLEIETLAEGIEDRAQLETLQREHCDHGQGFLFSRPLSVEDLEDFLGGARREPVPAAAS